MKKIIMTLIVLSIAIPVTLMAGDKEEIIEQIMKGNAYLNKNKKAMQEYSTKGALEFWSSGGLIHEISPSGRPESYERQRGRWMENPCFTLVSNFGWIRYESVKYELIMVQ